MCNLKLKLSINRCSTNASNIEFKDLDITFNYCEKDNIIEINVNGSSENINIDGFDFPFKASVKNKTSNNYDLDFKGNDVKMFKSSGTITLVCNTKKMVFDITKE